MCSIIRDPDHSITHLDLSGNLLTEDMINFLRMAMTTNKSLVMIDLRRNPGYSPDSQAIQEIEKILHDNDNYLRK
jgi:hypothetical protein